MANQLSGETSPYLLQHAGNPVDWRPWNPAALEESRRLNKPIFLSIGYSACHWCHVMEHESFENPAIARQLNADFIPIKVDREERPDLDQIYMNAVQMMTGRGGWPMSVFLTPDLKPFFGGTYWPPEPRQGMPGFAQVLAAVATAWRDRRPMAIEQAEELTNELRRVAAGPMAPDEPRLEFLNSAAAALEQAYDPRHGGFGQAPKFPHPMDLRLLLRVWKRSGKANLLEIVTRTLEKMAAGGIYDQLAGGFHRYSVDERWLVPHFEKMLYDNGLLIAAYVEAYQATGVEDFARVARETCDYLLREMTGPEGGFYSTQDADSEGIEGKFFVWTPAEIEAVLGAKMAKTFCYVYDVTPDGNFEEANILHLPKSLEQCSAILNRKVEELSVELATSRAKLLAAREKRVHPRLDDKTLVAWNGLAIEGLALAASALGEPRYLEAARRAADFLLSSLRQSDGRLWHTWRGGQAKLDAYLDDYAALVNGLVSLHQASFEERYLTEATKLAEILLRDFYDADAGGFYYTGSGHEALIARQKDWSDNATPSGAGLAATALARLGKLTGRNDFVEAARKTARAGAPLIKQASTMMGQMLLACDVLLGPTKEIAILGDTANADTAAALAALGKTFAPRALVAVRSPSAKADANSPLASLFTGKTPQGEQPTVFICENFSCQAPIAGREAALAAWKSL